MLKQGSSPLVPSRWRYVGREVTVTAYDHCDRCSDCGPTACELEPAARIHNIQHAGNLSGVKLQINLAGVKGPRRVAASIAASSSITNLSLFHLSQPMAGLTDDEV